MRIYNDITLESGAVARCRPVPPHATRDVLARIERPDPPYVELESKAGGSERAIALEGTPEWDEFQSAMKEYRRRIMEELGDFMLGYGVVAWKLDGEDGAWSDEPPEGWKMPKAMDYYGVATSDDPWERRLQFIRYGLILTDEDQDAVDRACRIIPVTQEEVKAAMGPFESNGLTVQ
jgi:hypothetical protein